MRIRQVARARERRDVVVVEIDHRQLDALPAAATQERERLRAGCCASAGAGSPGRASSPRSSTQIVEREPDDHPASQVVHQGLLLVVGRDHQPLGLGMLLAHPAHDEVDRPADRRDAAKRRARPVSPAAGRRASSASTITAAGGARAARVPGARARRAARPRRPASGRRAGTRASAPGSAPRSSAPSEAGSRSRSARSRPPAARGSRAARAGSRRSRAPPRGAGRSRRRRAVAARQASAGSRNSWRSRWTATIARFSSRPRGPNPSWREMADAVVNVSK